MNTLEEIKSNVRTFLNATFPFAAIKFEAIADDPYMLGVGVYGVAKNQVKWVEQRILDIESKLIANTDFVLIPLVRDLETTIKFYPQLLTTWKEVQVIAPAQWESVCDDPNVLNSDLGNLTRHIAADWPNRVEDLMAGIAANEELALAA